MLQGGRLPMHNSRKIKVREKGEVESHWSIRFAVVRTLSGFSIMVLSARARHFAHAR